MSNVTAESSSRSKRQLLVDPVRQACAQCRRRKVRCEDRRPCTRCIKSRIECNTGTSPSENKRPRLEDTASSMHLETESVDMGQWGSTLYLDPDGQVVLSGSTSGIPLIERLGGLHRPSSNSNQNTSWNPSNQSESPARVTDVHVYQAQSMSLKSTQPDFDPAATYTLWTQEGQVSQLISECCPPDLLNKIVRHHLSVTETLWPILHHSSFLQLYFQFTRADSGRKQAGMSPQFGALLMSIAAVNSRNVSDPRVLAASEDMGSAGLHYFQLAKYLLQRSENRLNLHYIQASYYLALYSEGLGKSTGRHLGEAVAIILTTGMHRASDSWDLEVTVKETRKRTFFAVFALDKACSSMLGRPPMIRLSDCNIELPAVFSDALTSKESSTKPNILLLAANASTQLHAILEQVLFACNTPPRPHGASADADTAFFYGVSRDEEIPHRDVILDRASSLVEEWTSRLPSMFTMSSAARQWDHVLDPKTERGMITLQALRLEIESNYVRALIARERLVFEMKTKADNQSLTDVGLRAKEASACIVRCYARLSLQGSLLPFFGVHHVIHLTCCGHTFLSVMAMYSAFSSESISDLEITIGLLQQSSKSFPSALRASHLLREMAAAFHIRLSIPPIPASLSRPVSWVRVLPRITPSESVSPTSTANDTTTPISDEAWLEMVAFGGPQLAVATSVDDSANSVSHSVHSDPPLSSLSVPTVAEPTDLASDLFESQEQDLLNTTTLSTSHGLFDDLFDRLGEGIFNDDSLTQLLMSRHATA